MGMWMCRRAAKKPEIGERVEVLPVHPCPCVNEHNEMIGCSQRCS